MANDIDYSTFCITEHHLTKVYGPPNPAVHIAKPGCELLIKNLPEDMSIFEIFEQCRKFGNVFQIKLAMDSSRRFNRGFSFAVFTTSEEAEYAQTLLNNAEIRPGFFLDVSFSEDRKSLSFWQCNKTLEEFRKEFQEQVKVNVSFGESNRENSVLVIFDSHSEAADIRTLFRTGKAKLFGITIIPKWFRVDDPTEEKINLNITDDELSEIAPYLLRLAMDSIKINSEACDFATYKDLLPRIIEWIDDEFSVNIEPHLFEAFKPCANARLQRQELLLYNYCYEAQMKALNEAGYASETDEHDDCKRNMISLLEEIETMQVSLSNLKKKVYDALGL